MGIESRNSSLYDSYKSKSIFHFYQYSSYYMFTYFGPAIAFTTIIFQLYIVLHFIQSIMKKKLLSQ